MATTVLFVPGFMGSVLSYYPAGVFGGPHGSAPLDLFGSVVTLFRLDWIETLSLDTPPAPPAQIAASGLAPAVLGGYTDFFYRMRHAAPQGWQWLAFPYDWRQSARLVGAQLADIIEVWASRGDQVMVVCHSYGALVAWCAWAHLVDRGHQGALTRLLSFGGAWYGGNCMWQPIVENEDSIGLLALLAAMGQRGAFGPAQGYYLRGSTDADVARILRVGATWPATYDLFPDPLRLDDPGDVNRKILFDPATWTSALVPPRADLMAQEVENMHLWVRQPKYAIPPQVVCHIIGMAQPTPYRVVESLAARDPKTAGLYLYSPVATPKSRRRVLLPTVSTTMEGDYRIMTNAQKFPGTYFQRINSIHGSQQLDPRIWRLIPAMLSMELPLPPPVLNPSLQPQAWDPPMAVPGMSEEFLAMPLENVTLPDRPQVRLKPQRIIRPRPGPLGGGVAHG